MSQQFRRALSSRMYSLIFRKILPDLNNGRKIGQTEHARKINAFSRERQRNAYDYGDYSHLGLKADSCASSPEFDHSVKENNFINWTNGTSSPKNLIIINSILEYVIETCRDDDKHMLLKYEVLQLLKSEEFTGYTEHLIDAAIRCRIRRIDSGDRDALFLAVRDVLYLLKNKPRFIQYMLAEQASSLAESASPLAESASPLAESASPLDASVSLLDEPTSPLDIPVSPLDEPALLLAGPASPLDEPVSRLAVPAGPIPEQTAIDVTLDNTDTAITANSGKKDIPWMRLPSSPAAGVAVIACCLLIILLPGGMSRSGGSAANSIDSLFQRLMILAHATLEPPEITQPHTDSQLPLEEIEVRWKHADRAESYTVAVTNTDTWEQALMERGIKEPTYAMAHDHFHAGGNYRIYVLSSRKGQDSEPNFVDITIQPVNPPRLTSPKDVSLLDLTDIVLEWEAVADADSYAVNVFEFSTWTSVYSRSGITGTQATMKGTIFQSRGRYRVFVNSMADKSESVPSYIDITFK